MADDQQPPPQRFWFPWVAPPPPPAPAPRPAVRPQLPRRDTRPAPQPSPPVAPSPTRRQAAQPHPGPTPPACRGAGGAPSPPAPAHPQPTRLSSRPSPSPYSRAPPLSTIREPNARAAPAPASEPVPITKEADKPAASPLHPTAHDVPRQKDITVPQEKTIQEPPAAADSKAVEKDKEKEETGEKERDKGKKEKGKEKEKEKEEHKDKGKKKEHKEKKDKEKEHREKDKSKEVVGEHVHGGKMHRELKAGVADMVHKLGSSAPSSGGGNGERPASVGTTTVITLAGENKGASMKVDSKDNEHQGHKLDGSVVVAGKEQTGGRGLTAFVNSNVQVLNNSLLLQSSCNGRDPGVHLKLSTKSMKKGDGGEEAGGKKK